MVDVDDEAARQPVHARPGDVAALHEDDRVAGVVERAVTSIVGDAGNSRIGGGAGSCATSRTSLPSALSASAIATCEPMASPSGRACDVTTNRRRARMAAATWSSVAVNHGRGLLSSRVVRRRSWRRRCASSSFRSGGSARCGPGAQSTRRTGTRSPAPAAAAGGSPIWRRRNGVARSSAFCGLLRAGGVAERRVVDARQLQVGRHLHARERDEADVGIVHLAAREHRAQLLADLVADAMGL